MTWDHLPPEKQALHEAAQVLGGQAAVAKVLGYTDRRNVSAWFATSRQLPERHCPTIEQATREMGKVVLCERLRPDVSWDVLRKNATRRNDRATASDAKAA